MAANRVLAINPPIDDRRPDTEIQYRPRKPHGLAKPSRLLSKREADTEFQYRPHIVDTDAIADTVFADAISETSIRDEASINAFLDMHGILEAGTLCQASERSTEHKLLGPDTSSGLGCGST